MSSKNFRSFLTANIVSMIGDWAFYVAITVFIFERYHDSFLLGILTVSYTLPAIILSSFAGVIADKFNRRTIMVITDLLGAVCLVLLPFAEKLWLILVIVFLEQGISVFFIPASSALLPSVSGDMPLMKANSFHSIATNLGKVVGILTGSWLLFLMGPRLAFFFDAGTYIIAALVTFLCIPSASGKVRRERSVLAPNPPPFFIDLREGATVVWRDYLLSSTIFLMCGIMVMSSLVTSFLILIVSDVLRASVDFYGPLSLVVSVGSVVGGLLVSRAKRKIPQRPSFLFFCVFILSIVSVTLLASNQWIPWTIFLLLVFGLCESVGTVHVQTTIHTYGANHLHGRLFGITDSLYNVVFLSTALVGGTLLKYMSIQNFIVTVALFVLLFGNFLLLHHYRKFNIAIKTKKRGR